jgi:hypothetical protein
VCVCPPLPFYRSGVPGSKLCPKFSEFSVDSEITGLSQSSLSIKAFVHPAAVMMVLTDIVLLSLQQMLMLPGTMCMKNISVNSCFVQNCFQPSCTGISSHRLMWLLVAYQQVECGCL